MLVLPAETPSKISLIYDTPALIIPPVAIYNINNLLHHLTAYCAPCDTSCDDV